MYNIVAFEEGFDCWLIVELQKRKTVAALKSLPLSRKLCYFSHAFLVDSSLTVTFVDL